MATYKYEMPDAQAEKMVQAFCQQYSYQPTVTQSNDKGQQETVANPVSPTEFAFNKVKRFIDEVITAHWNWEANQAVPDVVAEKREEFGELQIEITES